MSITIELRPEMESNLQAQAQARGVSLTDFVNEIIAREASLAVPETAETRSGQALIDVCAEIRGVLTDEEIDTLFARNRSMSIGGSSISPLAFISSAK